MDKETQQLADRGIAIVKALRPLAVKFRDVTFTATVPGLDGQDILITLNAKRYVATSVMVESSRG